MDNYYGMPYCEAVLMNEDKSQVLVIGFLGYSKVSVEEYMDKHFVKSDKPCTKRWVYMKYVGID